MKRILLAWTLLTTFIFAEVLIKEDFNKDNLIPEGWNANFITIMGPGDYHQMAQIRAITGYLIPPPLDQPASLDCIIYVTSAGPGFVVETSLDGESYQPHPGSPPPHQYTGESSRSCRDREQAIRNQGARSCPA